MFLEEAANKAESYFGTMFKHYSKNGLLESKMSKDKNKIRYRCTWSTSAGTWQHIKIDEMTREADNYYE